MISSVMNPIGLLCLFVLVSGQVRIDPLVSTKVGLIRGLRTNDGYSQFGGIPYALVNETNPFGPPLPNPTFDDGFEAYDVTIKCPQIEEGEVTGILQCLIVNVFVPDTATSQNRLPVMVWIHGGGFVDGNGHSTGFNPKALLNNDIILVSLNYRLNVYGFMCLDTPEVPGNQGLKDQVLALRWIKDNIEAFGGDVTKITAVGESAGAVSVNLHMFSPHEKLFNKAILQSNSALTPIIFTESDSVVPLRVAEKLGFETTDTSSALAYLTTVDPHLVVVAAYDEQSKTKVCVEKVFEDVENFITDHPMNMKPTKFVPVIMGYNNNEAGFQLEKVAPEYFDTYNFDTHLNHSFSFNENLNEALEVISHFYIGDEEISENVRFQIINFASDYSFTHPVERMAEQFLDAGVHDVYRYVFSYSGGKNYLKIGLNMTAPGATHVDEIGYLFDMKVSEETPKDRVVVNRITKLWTNFIKSGDPTPETTDLIPVKWTPMTKVKHYYLNIDSELTLESRPFHKRMAFWDLFYKLYGKYQKWYKPSKE